MADVEARLSSKSQAVEHTVQSSTSEEQGMCWSPNGKWVTFHSHFGPSDDLWIEPADGSQPSRQITRDGHETGWPRWSPDGKWLVYPSHVNDRPKARIYVVGMDQETGTVTQPQEEVPLEGFTQHAMQTEWMPDSETLVFESAGPPGKKAIYTVPRTGGTPRLIHRWDSEQHYSGIGLSPDGRWGRLRGTRPKGLLPDLSRARDRWQAGADHLRPHGQDPTILLPQRGPYRLYGLQLPVPILAPH